MNSQDILNIALAIGFLAIVVCVAFITYYSIQALKSITHLSDSLEDTAQSVKNRLQMRFISAIPPLLAALIARIFKRRG